VSSYYHKFGTNDVFYNRLKTDPRNEFFIWDSKVFYNNKSKEVGEFTGSVPGVPTGHISLYELNVDRDPLSTTGPGVVYPYIVKTSDKWKFATMTDISWNHDYLYGATITGSYTMSASIGRQYFATGLSSSTSKTGSALKNSFNYYSKISPYYAYSCSLFYKDGVKGEGPYDHIDKSSEKACLITIPSIFYGSSIKKGTVDLKFYVTGTLMGRLQDYRRNGELIQTEPVGSTGSGSIAGMVLYNEGFVYLSGSWDLDSESYTFDASSTPKWVHFGSGITGDGLASGDSSRVKASFNLAFSGTNYVPNITMMAHAKKGELNHSNNWSYMEYNTDTSSLVPFTSETSYLEQDLTIKNTVSSAYADPTGSFQKTTYISKIGIYDDDKNLIGIASLAKPVKKTEDRDLTFKLKLDI